MDISNTSKNYFSEEELRCPCCGENGFSPITLQRLNNLRAFLGFPLPMTSGYRCLKYNRQRGFTQTHATGQAADLAVSHIKAFQLIEAAPRFGFTGIGVRQKGNTRFIHLDDLESNINRPRPHIWSY